MTQLGKVLPRLIETLAGTLEERGDVMFSKLDIKDGFWRMIVQF